VLNFSWISGIRNGSEFENVKSDSTTVTFVVVLDPVDGNPPITTRAAAGTIASPINTTVNMRRDEAFIGIPF
jgi:hypothetical protein